MLCGVGVLLLCVFMCVCIYVFVQLKDTDLGVDEIILYIYKENDLIIFPPLFESLPLPVLIMTPSKTVLASLFLLHVHTIIIIILFTCVMRTGPQIPRHIKTQIQR